MKKALLVTRVSGFVPQHEMNNVRILQEMGYEVHYATDLHNVVYGKDNSRLEGSGIITHQIDFCRSPFSHKVKLAQKQLEKLMLEESFDLVHCHMPMSAVVTRRAARRVRKQTGKQVPVLYTAHGFHFCHGVSWKNWLYYPIERHYARYTDRLLLINEEDYRRGTTFPIRGKVVKINGVGIRLDNIKPYEKQTWRVGTWRRGTAGQTDTDRQGGEVDLAEDGRSIRRQFGLPENCAILVSVGELSPSKNHLVAIEAMDKLRDMNIAYLICGTGRMEDKLRRRVQELRLEKRVCFAGYVGQIPALLQQSDCFFFPSGREGLPVAVMEAMAVGLPVIAANIRGVYDLVEDTKGGYLVDGFSPMDYADRVRKLFASTDNGAGIGSVERNHCVHKADEEAKELRRKQMGLWNRERIQEFSMEVVERQMRQVYSEVVRE